MAIRSPASTFSSCAPYLSDSSSFTAPCSLRKIVPLPARRRKELVIFAVLYPRYVRKPLLPTNGILSKPTARISERAICTDVEPGSKIELTYAKTPKKDFVEFMLTTPKEEVIDFFKDIAAEVQGFRQLQDFHMKLRESDGSFQVEVFFNESRIGPETSSYLDCIGCCLDTNLFVGQEPGMASGECILEEFSLRPHAVCRLDAKGRSGFSIMPVRHVERMSDLNDEEVYAMWSIAARLLRHAHIPFISLIMNHGSYRTFYHLNLKIWVDDDAHKKFMSGLSEETRELWDRLQKYAANRPKRRQMCFFFKRDGRCRHGEFCSYLHDEYQQQRQLVA